MPITASLTVVPGSKVEFAFEGTTVADLLAVAGVSASGKTIYVNDVLATTNTVITDEADVRLHVAPTTVNVKVSILPGTPKPVTLNGTRTVAAAIEAAGLNPSGYKVTIGTRAVDLTDLVSDGDKVFLARPIQGN